MKKIRTIFMGTGDIGVKLLKSTALNGHFEVSLVITGPDRPAGRKMSLQASAIKKIALELGLEVFQPENVNSPESIARIKALTPDILLVMAFGQLLNQEILDIPHFDCLNVHASILPKYRGASPIQSAILNGEKETGISLMKMVKKMDAGAVYSIFRIPVTKKETAFSLEQKLSELSSEKIPQTLIDIIHNKTEPLPQNEQEASHVTKINKKDGLIHWNDEGEKLERRIRAFNPWPSCYTFFKGKRLKIHLANFYPITKADNYGEAVRDGDFIGILAKGGMIEPLSVQLEGKKNQSMKEFLNGNPDFLGSVLPN